jgi:hypothetical protein
MYGWDGQSCLSLVLVEADILVCLNFFLINSETQECHPTPINP